MPQKKSKLQKSEETRKRTENKEKKYDLHIHSYYSKCSRNKPQDILRYAKKAGLDGIAITDHHTMKAYPILKGLNKDSDFEIIAGEEITTQFGDVIGLYLKQEIKSREFFAVIKEIRSQGGLVIIAHPYRFLFEGTKYEFSRIKDKIDAIEAFNSRNLSLANEKAKNKALELSIAQVGSSDAHILSDIGNGYTVFHGELKDAILKKKTQAFGKNTQWMISGGIAFMNSKILYPLFGRKVIDDEKKRKESRQNKEKK